MKRKTIVTLLVCALVVSSVAVANAESYYFNDTTISETAWKAFVSNVSASLPEFKVYVIEASKPVVGQCFMASDNYTWASALYTYPTTGNGGFNGRPYLSGVTNGTRVNWRMRTNNDTTGAATVRGYFQP